MFRVRVGVANSRPLTYRRTTCSPSVPFSIARMARRLLLSTQDIEPAAYLEELEIAFLVRIEVGRAGRIRAREPRGRKPTLRLVHK